MKVGDTTIMLNEYIVYGIGILLFALSVLAVCKALAAIHEADKK